MGERTDSNDRPAATGPPRIALQVASPAGETEKRPKPTAESRPVLPLQPELRRHQEELPFHAVVPDVVMRAAMARQPPLPLHRATVSSPVVRLADSCLPISETRTDWDCFLGLVAGCDAFRGTNLGMEDLRGRVLHASCN